MKFHLVLALVLLCPLAHAQAVAPDVPIATIAAVTGEVMLAQGAQIAPAKAGATLQAGDRVMTMDDADVLIAFADGCNQRLPGQSLLAIGETSGCDQGPGRLRSFRQAIGEPGGGAAAPPRLSTGEKVTVAAAVLVPLLWLWDHNRDDDGREPVSR
ncbi:hypothetical protein [Tahibacter harae]|uniref:Uncharacterized protein n=1 Tax=Tahibacter harae TaxID=2963937 RepID=A0ABT1QT75_9GAMM|nr:hypothetical protein [Tahibacter harae]MCQ4165471.1 hypothetical protein [Tahibacter harae]